jgi:hypothetical protein
MAGIIEYEFNVAITDRGVMAPLAGAAIGPEEVATVRFLVDDTIGSTGSSTYRYYENAIVGGTVQAKDLLWNLGGNGENFVAIWNDELTGGGNVFDGLWLQAPLSGPSLNGLTPTYLGIALFSYRSDQNETFAQSILPQALTLADFNAVAGGSMAFSKNDVFGRFDLAVKTATVTAPSPVPEPSTWLLVLGSFVVLISRSASFTSFGFTCFRRPLLRSPA